MRRFGILSARGVTRKAAEREVRVGNNDVSRMQLVMDAGCRFQSQEAPGEQDRRQLGVAAEDRVGSVTVGVEQEPRDGLGRQIHHQDVAPILLELPKLGQFPPSLFRRVERTRVRDSAEPNARRTPSRSTRPDSTGPRPPPRRNPEVPDVSPQSASVPRGGTRSSPPDRRCLSVPSMRAFRWTAMLLAIFESRFIPFTLSTMRQSAAQSRRWNQTSWMMSSFGLAPGA